MSSYVPDPKGLIVNCRSCSRKNRIAFDRIGAEHRCPHCKSPIPAPDSAVDVPSADLSITKDDGVASYTPGGTVTTGVALVLAAAPPSLLAGFRFPSSASPRFLRPPASLIPPTHSSLSSSSSSPSLFPFLPLLPHRLLLLLLFIIFFFLLFLFPPLLVYYCTLLYTNAATDTSLHSNACSTVANKFGIPGV